MTEIKKKLAASIATGAIVMNAFVPGAYAATTIQISGNGSGSDNSTDVSKSNTTTVVQNNTANIDNKVEVKADTGNNSASDNTGGDVKIHTGDADVDVNVENYANKNTAEVENCDCDTDTEVLIKGNGSKSDNNVDLSQKNSVGVYQDNDADIENKVDVYATTGGNDADDNTGGDVKVYTGDADVEVNLMTAANENSARVSGNGNGGELSARIIGNGSDSDNDIDLDFDNQTVVKQNNDADIENDVDVEAKTGYNDANDNTGGDVLIYTGDANAEIGVDNQVNFNWADVDCGCLMDVLAKIDGNGSDSESDIEASLDNKSEAFQDNDADIENDLDDITLKTGKNDANDNTGYEGSDPVVHTGDADGVVTVSNESNMNGLGEANDHDMDFHFGFSFDMKDLLDYLMNR